MACELFRNSNNCSSLLFSLLTRGGDLAEAETGLLLPVGFGWPEELIRIWNNDNSHDNK